MSWPDFLKVGLLWVIFCALMQANGTLLKILAQVEALQ